MSPGSLIPCAGVGGLESQISGQGALDTKAPLLRIRRAIAPIDEIDGLAKRCQQSLAAAGGRTKAARKRIGYIRGGRQASIDAGGVRG